jgi:hypothetical protein
MKLISILLAAILVLAGRETTVVPPARYIEGKADSIYDITIPAGYRDWKLISVAHEEGTLNDLRAVLGNDKAVKAYRQGKRSFPDGAIIARIAWKHVPSEENNKAFGRQQSFVAGPPTNVQFSIKNAKKYALSDGWGYAQFNEGQLVNVAVNARCLACHQAVKDRDFVFTKYSH